MKKRVVLLALGLLAVSSGDVAAQTAVQSFGDLSEAVTPGMTVVVDLADGRTRSGKVVSLSGDRIEIRRRRWNWRAEQLTFGAGSVRRIENRDSTWNGEFLGAGAGALVAWVRCKTGGPRSGVDVGCFAWSFVAPIGGGIAGHVIDRNHRRPLYIAPGGTRIQLAPTHEAGIGIAATIGF
jgi:hypothetical protein